LFNLAEENLNDQSLPRNGTAGPFIDSLTSGKAAGLVCEPFKAVFYSGCQKNVPLFERFFPTTTYTTNPYFGIYFLKAV
jgi:hypothetical protein